MMYVYAPRHFRVTAGTDQPVTSWMHDRELSTELIRQHFFASQTANEEAG